MGHLIDKFHTLRGVIQNLIDNEVIIINTQEVDSMPTPSSAHPGLPGESSPEFTSSKDAGTSGVNLLTLVLADSISSPMGPSDLISLAPTSLVVPSFQSPLSLGQLEQLCKDGRARDQSYQGSTGSTSIGAVLAPRSRGH